MEYANKKVYDDKKIAFIVCVNNELLFNECCFYINRIAVPEEYKIEIIGIREAHSIAEAYNAASADTDAKYKVYIHQDVYILNENLIYDCLRIFENSKIGMLGVIGCDIRLKSARYEIFWNIGSCFVSNGFSMETIEMNSFADDDYKYVEAVDGMFIMTQYDVPWDEELGDWHFYDIAISERYKKAGYMIAVPYQEKPWCFHDSGICSQNGYEKKREQFCNLYEGYLYSKNDADGYDAVKSDFESGKNAVIDLLNMGDIKSAAKVAHTTISSFCDSEMAEMVNLIVIAQEELATNGSTHIFTNLNIRESIELFTLVKMMCRRIEFGFEENCYNELIDSVKCGGISHVFANYTIDVSCINKDKVKQIVFDKYTAEDMPLVSVVVPIYNGAKFVGDTINSIIDQNYKNLQIILVDDCSSDDSYEVIKAYAARDNRIEVYQTPQNSNVCYAANYGYKFAKGKYIATPGHDDVFLPEKIEKQVKFMEENKDVAVCFTLCDLIDDEGKVFLDDEGITELFRKTNKTRGEWIVHLLREGNCFCAPSALIRMNSLEGRNKLYDYSFVQLQDYALWLELLKDNDIYIIQEILTHYRHFSGDKNLSSLSHGKNNRLQHEMGYIDSRFVRTIPDKAFKKVFRKYFTYKDSYSKDELDCERAILLMKLKNPYCIESLTDLLEQDYTRDLLEKKYNFRVTDFYKFSTESLCFDFGEEKPYSTDNRFKDIKLIIWDLDDTFWSGVLSETDIIVNRDNIELIKTLSYSGIINSISSKNDEETVLKKLEEIENGLTQYFVFNNINWEAKGPQINDKIKKMNLRAENVLFIDDNPHNLEEALQFNEGLMTFGPQIIPELSRYIADKVKAEAGSMDTTLSRLTQYHLLEQKCNEREKSDSNEQFLYDSEIVVDICFDCRPRIDRISELVERTNQLNYTKNRCNRDEIEKQISSDWNRSAYISVRDKFGDYGIVGFFCYNLFEKRMEHFLFSCRIMGMGVEQYVYSRMGFPNISVAEPVAIKLESGKTIDWIHEDTEKTIEQQKCGKVSDNRPRILLKGPCDLSAIEQYLIGGCITSEFNFVNNKGFVTTGQNHSVHIFEGAVLDETELQKILEDAPFLIHEDFDTHLFDKEYNVVCYSLLPDCHAGLYKHKETGLFASFGSCNFDLTDEANWKGYIDGSIPNHFYPFTEEVLRSFKDSWVFEGTTPDDLLLYNLEYMYDNIPGRPMIILLLGSEIEYEGDNAEFANHAERHQSINRLIEKFAVDKTRIRLINLTDFIKNQSDYEDSINHFSRRVYYDLATEVVKCINES